MEPVSAATAAALYYSVKGLIELGAAGLGAADRKVAQDAEAQGISKEAAWAAIHGEAKRRNDERVEKLFDPLDGRQPPERSPQRTRGSRATTTRQHLNPCTAKGRPRPLDLVREVRLPTCNPVTLRKHRVHERLRQVDPPAARLQHPLDQLLLLGAAEDDVGQLVSSAASDEDTAGVVDPELPPLVGQR